VWLEERPALEGVNKISDFRFQIEKIRRKFQISKTKFEISKKMEDSDD
jgi:hypothetical protein